MICLVLSFLISIYICSSHLVCLYKYLLTENQSSNSIKIKLVVVGLFFSLFSDMRILHHLEKSRHNHMLFRIFSNYFESQ